MCNVRSASIGPGRWPRSRGVAGSVSACSSKGLVSKQRASSRIAGALKRAGAPVSARYMQDITGQFATGRQRLAREAPPPSRIRRSVHFARRWSPPDPPDPAAPRLTPIQAGRL